MSTCTDTTTSTRTAERDWHFFNMKINSKFQSLIPPLAKEELAQLETNIKADGCRDPMVTWNGTLLDGHNRYAICQKHGIQFKTVAMDFEDEDAACVWVIHNQFGRRNLQPFTRVELALKLEPLLRKKAKENQVRKPESVKQKSAEQKPIETREELAHIAHVSHDTIAKGKIILERASEETKEALRRGDTSINAEHHKLTVRIGQNSGENEWYTPTEFVEAAREVMGGIDCDPASSEIANRTVKAKKFFDKAEDGLGKKWAGRVFLNPPYAQPLVSQFSEAVAAKFESGEIEQAVVLVNNATETGWFARIAGRASAVCFPSSRIKFVDPSGAKTGPPLQGQAVLYLGPNRKEFCQRFAPMGIVWWEGSLCPEPGQAKVQAEPTSGSDATE